MEIGDVIEKLRALNDPSASLRLPTEAEVDAAEARLRFEFPADYRRYLLEASDVSHGGLEPAIVTPGPVHLDLVETAETAWNDVEVPRSLLPICEDNGDYYCLKPTGEVVYWSHDGEVDEEWPNLATWIRDVWIDEG